MSRIKKVRERVDDLYQKENPNRADWADWLYHNHVMDVAERAGVLSDRFGAKKELAMAAGMLHDIADAVGSRFDPRHKEKSVEIARKILHESGFLRDEIDRVVDDAIARHNCREGVVPQSQEGRVMATADALAHIQTDFYKHAVQKMKLERTTEEIKKWALAKIERDFRDKIFFEDVREEAQADYDKLKKYFSQKRL